MRISRADRSRVADWWFTVDHALLAAIIGIIGAGLVLSLAASPAVAIKKGLPTYYFVERQIVFSALGLVVMLAVSLLSPRRVRRLGLLLLGVSLVGLVAVLAAGPEINGARRWLFLAGHSFQPSEFMKPAFVVVCGWLLAQSEQRTDVPALALALAIWGLVAVLLVGEPDIGQTMLISAVWCAMYFLSGKSLLGAGAFAGAGIAGLGVAYWAFPHVRLRFDKYLGTLPGDNTQVDRAMQSFTEGGFFGRGPGEGTIKVVLPDAHTDFIFAVVAEEYGVIACLALLALFAYVVLRALSAARSEPDAAIRLSVAGLALLFGLQALINMGVNIGLLPAKGMTLPFISAGGSSTLAVSVTLGMTLALTRRRPEIGRLKRARMLAVIDVAEPAAHSRPPLHQ